MGNMWSICCCCCRKRQKSKEERLKVLLNILKIKYEDNDELFYQLIEQGEDEVGAENISNQRSTPLSAMKSANKYLEREERKPLTIGSMHVPAIATRFDAIIQPYNRVLELLIKLKDKCTVLSQDCPPKEINTLDNTFIYITSLIGMVDIHLSRDLRGELYILYDEESFLYAKAKSYLLIIEELLEIINELEIAEQQDPSGAVAELLGTTCGKYDVITELEGTLSEDDDLEESLANCRAGIDVITTVPRRWNLLMDEKNDLIKEFLKGLEHLMMEPRDLTRPKYSSTDMGEF